MRRFGKKLGFGRLLLRGESMIAGAGLLVGVILLVTMVGLAIGTHRLTYERASDAQNDRVEARTDELVRVIPGFVERGSLTELRRLVQSTAEDGSIDMVQVVLGDGSVLASSNLDDIDVGEIPGVLPEFSGAGVQRGKRVDTAMGPLGVVVVETQDVPFDGWAIQAAVGGAGAIALAGLWLVYRSLRRKVGALGAIREALLAAADGETCIGALTVGEDLGPAACAWNSLLSDREALRERLLRERVDETLVGSRVGSGAASDACDALWHGILALDDQGRISYANGAAAVFLERDRDELRGLTFESLVSDASLRAAVSSVVRCEVKRRISVEVVRKGEREDVLRFTVRPLRGLDGGDALVVIEDITQQRVAARATGGFVAQATHELRTPLTNIRLYVEEAIDLNDGDAGERSRCLGVINQESRRLERLVGDMLSVTEMESGSMVLQIGDVRLERVVSELREEYEAQALDRGVALVFDMPPKYPVFGADRDKLAIVMHNLLGNAIKYTGSEGKVTVRLTADENELGFEVRDTGIGIGEDDLLRVFEAFYRTDEARSGGFGGTGLGLAISREIAKLHGGEILLESDLGRGSTFTLRMPNASVVDRAVAA